MRKILVMTLLPLAGCARDPGEARLRPDAQPTVRVAEAAIAANAPEVALNVTRGILRGDPFNVPAQLAQGAALYALGDLAQAATAYRTVLTVQPRSAEAQLGIGRVHLARDEAREAEAAFRASLAIEARAPAWSNLGIALDVQNRHAEAQAAYREALKLDPRNEGARANLAVSAAMASGLPLPAAPSGPGAMQLSAADPADPMAYPFAVAADPRRRMHGARDAAAQTQFPAGQLPAGLATAAQFPAAQFPMAQFPMAQHPLPQLPAAQPPAAPVLDTYSPDAQAAEAQSLVPQPVTSQAGAQPVQPAAAAFGAALGAASSAPPAAPDAVAQVVQIALSPGGQGLLPVGPATEAVAPPPRPERRQTEPAPAVSGLPVQAQTGFGAGSRLPALAPALAVHASFVAPAAPASDLLAAGFGVSGPAWPDALGAGLVTLASASGPFPRSWQEAVPASYPVVSEPLASRTAAPRAAASQPAASATAALPVQERPQPPVRAAAVRAAATAPVPAAPPAFLPTPVPARAQGAAPAATPAAAAVPAPSPAPVPSRPMLAQSDRFDPSLVPMPVVPPGARPTALAMVMPTSMPSSMSVSAERSTQTEDGRWLRAAR